MIKELGNGKARLIVSVGHDENRRRYTKTVTYKGKKDLKAQYAEFESKVRGDKLPQSLTVRELLSWYIDHQETRGIKETTLDGYIKCVRRIERHMMVDVEASSISLFHIDRCITAMIKKGLSPKTIKNTISVLNSAYGFAVKTGVLMDNPCEQASLPKRARKEIIVYNSDEVKLFEDAIKGEILDAQVAYLLALYCGLRRSEILGLEEKHVSLDFKMLSIKQTRHRINQEDVVQDTKTKSSDRVVGVPVFVLELIAQLIDQHHAQPFETSSFLIQDGFGQPMKPQYLGKHLDKLNKKYGLPHVTVHGLRHTHATMLNAAGVDMIRISKQLGHAEPSITANIYTHLFGKAHESTRAIADDFDRLHRENAEKSQIRAHDGHKIG